MYTKFWSSSYGIDFSKAVPSVNQRDLFPPINCTPKYVFQLSPIKYFSTLPNANLENKKLVEWSGNVTADEQWGRGEWKEFEFMKLCVLLCLILELV